MLLCCLSAIERGATDCQIIDIAHYVKITGKQISSDSKRREFFPSILRISHARRANFFNDQVTILRNFSHMNMYRFSLQIYLYFSSRCSWDLADSRGMHRGICKLLDKFAVSVQPRLVARFFPTLKRIISRICRKKVILARDRTIAIAKCETSSRDDLRRRQNFPQFARWIRLAARRRSAAAEIKKKEKDRPSVLPPIYAIGD